MTPRTLHRSGDYLSQPARLLEIDARVRAGNRPSHAALAHELGVSTRTIQRDFDYLRFTLGAPLEYDARRKGWFYGEESFFLPSVLATARDVRALLLVRAAVAQHAGTPYADSATRALELIARALPERERVGAAWVGSKVAFADFPSAEIEPAVWETVLEGLREERTLVLSYRRPGQSARRRRVDPYGLIVSGGDWYVHGLSHRHGERRTFLLSRIRRAEATEERKWHRDQRESRDAEGRLTIEFEDRAPFRLSRRLAEAAAWIERVEWLDSAAPR